MPEEQPQFQIPYLPEGNTEKALKEHREKLAKAKSLSELVVSVSCTVNTVTTQSFETTHTPLAEASFGGSSPVYSGGYTQKTTLQVTPADNSQLRIITFNGFCSVRGGDTIEALIPCYEEISKNPFEKTGGIYIPREMNHKEESFELIILSGGKIIRSERAIDYTKYAPEGMKDLIGY